MNSTATPSRTGKIMDPATYEEPEVSYNETELSVPAEGVRPGDLRNNKEVASVRTGSKWVYLQDSSGKTIEEVKKGDEVTVVRRELTPESATMQYRARANRAIAEKLVGRKGPLAAVQAKINEELEKYGAVSVPTLARLLVVQAELQLLNELAASVSRAGEGEDLVDVQRDFAEHCTHKLVRDTRQRSLSRSGGTMVERVLEDADRDAMAEFIERVRWAF